jgi:hypothetical protein
MQCQAVRLFGLSFLTARDVSPMEPFISGSPAQNTLDCFVLLHLLIQDLNSLMRVDLLSYNNQYLQAPLALYLDNTLWKSSFGSFLRLH